MATIDWTSVFSILGTFVLAAILIQQSYATYEERKDKKMERQKEQNETPHFVFSKFAFDPETMTIGVPKLAVGKGEKNTVETHPVRINVLKVVVKNAGEMVAVNAKGFIEIAGSPMAWPGMWTTHLSWGENTITLLAPPSVGIAPDQVYEFLNIEFFAKEFWSNHWERNIMGGSLHPLVLLFTVEGSEYAYSTNSAIKPMKLPFETGTAIAVNMENAKTSQFILPKFRITAWNKFEQL